ncbi:hypothetical protein AAG906_019289 [Vitis piasezkii]
MLSLSLLQRVRQENDPNRKCLGNLELPRLKVATLLLRDGKGLLSIVPTRMGICPSNKPSEMGRSLLLRLFLKREFCFNWILERQFFDPEVNRSCYRIRIWLCCFLSGLWWYLDFFSSSPAAHEPPASSALSSSSAGGRTSLLYSDLSDLASSGSNEAREAVEGD